MTELIMILGMAGSVALFAAGGTWLKALRRYIMPLLLFGCLYCMGVNFWMNLISMGTLCGVLHLGYGESVGWLGKFLVGMSYAFPALIIGFTWWIFIVPVVFWVMFFLSNWQPTKESFTWKICEGAYGFIIAASVLTAALQRWI